jgi:hypothetical protein
MIRASYPVPQRSRSATPAQGAAFNRRRASEAAAGARLQGADRQFRLLAICPRPSQQRTSRRSKSIPGGSPKRPATTAPSFAHYCPDHPIAGGIALLRSAATRRSIPPRQSDPQDTLDLSFHQRRHPQPCCASSWLGAAKELAGLCQSRGLVIELADLLRDLDPLPRGDDREGRQAHHHPHSRCRLGRQRLPGRRYHPAAQSLRTRSLILRSLSPAAM